MFSPSAKRSGHVSNRRTGRLELTSELWAAVSTAFINSGPMSAAESIADSTAMVKLHSASLCLSASRTIWNLFGLPPNITLSATRCSLKQGITIYAILTCRRDDLVSVRAWRTLGRYRENEPGRWLCWFASGNTGSARWRSFWGGIRRTSV